MVVRKDLILLGKCGRDYIFMKTEPRKLYYCANYYGSRIANIRLIPKKRALEKLRFGEIIESFKD